VETEGITTLSDEALLGLVASRNERAFSELVSRHQHVAYCLALHAVHNRSLAEEVVQESMLAVWLSAQKVSADSAILNARAWILKIVARQSFKTLRKRHSQRREVQLEERSPQPAGVPDSAPLDVIDALRQKLLHLDDDDRQLITLHFGGGLSQDEISRELNVARSTISYRLNRVLQELRVAMGGGVASVALDANILQATVCSGHVAPASICSGLQAKLHTAKIVQISTRTKAPVSFSVSSKLILAAGLVTTSIAGVLVYSVVAKPQAQEVLQQVPPARPPDVKPPAPAAVPVPVAEPAPKTVEKTELSWNFPNDYSPEVFTTLKGTLDPDPARKGLRFGPTTITTINKALPAAPLLIDAEYSFDSVNKRVDFGFHSVALERQDLLKQSKEYRAGPLHMTKIRFTVRCYVIDTKIVTIVNNEMKMIAYFDAPIPSLALVNSNVVMHNLKIRSVGIDEIPAAILKAIEAPEKNGLKL
jgi:RNA polymerase sigma factor (sigma-70 family)